jgi:hypothetical protein
LRDTVRDVKASEVVISRKLDIRGDVVFKRGGVGVGSLGVCNGFGSIIRVRNARVSQ